MTLIHQEQDGKVITTYKNNMIVSKKNGKTILTFDPMLMYDFLKFHMNPRSKSSGIARRAKALKLDRLQVWTEEVVKQMLKTPKD